MTTATQAAAPTPAAGQPATSPPPTRASRKKTNWPTVIATILAERPAPVAIEVSTARIMTAARSSKSATPKTNSLKLRPTFSSENALAMMVVLEIAISAPVKTPSSFTKPSSLKCRYCASVNACRSCGSGIDHWKF